MKNIDIPAVEPNDEDNLVYVTEVSYESLVREAIKAKMLPLVIIPPFDELADEKVAQQFKDACKSVLDCLKNTETRKD